MDGSNHALLWRDAVCSAQMSWPMCVHYRDAMTSKDWLIFTVFLGGSRTISPCVEWEQAPCNVLTWKCCIWYFLEPEPNTIRSSCLFWTLTPFAHFFLLISSSSWSALFSCLLLDVKGRSQKRPFCLFLFLVDSLFSAKGIVSIVLRVSPSHR